MATTNASQDQMRVVAWALALGALVIGWFFIVWQNKFHLSAPVVMLCLGYLAVVLTVANLWRVGAAAVAPEDASAEAWSRPIGERDELEKEKKTLLKAIKEAEFDLAMGKLSKVDADQLVTMYKTRAIAVIKELERLDGIAAAADKRGQIQREIAARLSLEGVSKKKKDKAAKAAAKAAKAEAAAKAAKPAEKPAKFAEPPKPKAADADDDEDEEEDDDESAASAETAKSDAKSAPEAKTDAVSATEVKSAAVKAANVKTADVKSADVNDADVKAADVTAATDDDAKPATFAEPPKADEDASKGASS